jgi:signal transduction histidine kinase
VAADPAQAGVSPLLATVAHELRSPLVSIIGYTDLLERGTFGALPPRSGEALGRIRHSGLRLLHLINDMLDVARLEKGRGAIELGPTDLNAVVGDAVAAVQPQVQQRELALRLELPPGLPLALANRERLEQVLVNLLSNAIKFTDQGSITVRTAHDGEQVAFSVSDTGIGIPPEQQGSIFHPFEQIDNEHTRRARGIGLGLALSQQLMKAMGGTLRVESALGVGSTFHGELAIAGEQLVAREHGSA